MLSLCGSIQKKKEYGNAARSLIMVQFNGNTIQVVVVHLRNILAEPDKLVLLRFIDILWKAQDCIIDKVWQL